MYTDDVVFVFTVPPIAEVIWEWGHSFEKVSSDRLVKPGIGPGTPGLHSRRLIHYTTAASPLIRQCKKCLSGPMISQTTVLSSVNILKLYLAWPLLDIFPFH